MRYKGILLGLLFLCLTLTLVACISAENKVLKTNTPVVKVSSIISTSTFTPSQTATSAIYETPTFDMPPTVTLESLSLLKSTATPFVSPKKFTPAPPAICPKVNSSVTHLDIGPVSETFGQSYEKPLLDFLNDGGSIDVLRQELKRIMDWFIIRSIDVTNDSIPELVIEANKLYILGCADGKFQTLLVIDPIPIENYSPSIQIQDMNLDGIPELIISRTYGGQTPSIQVYIFEWDGKKFRSLLAKDNVCSRHLSIYACIYDGVPDILGGEVKLKDIDNNGTIELIITGGNSIVGGDAIAYHPTRDETLVWKWNGEEFVLSSMKLSKPYYRFQAIEDGDEASLSKDYEKALVLYWQAINDNKLAWWSPSIKDYNLESFGNQTPIPTPAIDSSEYPRLAAYAYYRIMLIYVLQGQLINAQKIYEITQTKFGKSEQEFTGLATAFWSEYNKSHTIENACQQTIKYAENNREVIEKLGVFYYNFLSNKIYQPNDICPFK